SRRLHTRFSRDWSSDVCSSDLSVHFSLHSIIPFHIPHIAFEIATRGILVGLSRCEYGLLTDHSFSIDLLMITDRIEYFPMPADKPGGIVTVVFDGNTIGKHIMHI